MNMINSFVRLPTGEGEEIRGKSSEGHYILEGGAGRDLEGSQAVADCPSGREVCLREGNALGSEKGKELRRGPFCERRR
jgi:hypothetical protein